MARKDDGEPMGALIKRYREDQGITQRELAVAAGMSVGALRDLEQGRTRSPRWGTLEELAAVLGVDQAQRAELTLAWQLDAGLRSRQPRADLRRRRPAMFPNGARVNVLGPLTVWRDGALLGLGSARQRAVLGLLALHAGGGVHRDAITDMLWGERPPASAVAEVQGYVSRLRKMLGGKDLLPASGPCYRLAAGAGQLDLTAFRMLLSQAQDAVARSDLARGCDRYEQALGLWRGDVLADVDLARDHPAAVEASCLRADAVLSYAETALMADAPARALPRLRELCGRDPLNERAHARLMITLAAAGQQAAALQVFTGLRDRLDAELGLPPSPVLAEAHLRVLGHDWSV